MRKLLPALMGMTLSLNLLAESSERLTMTSWHLSPAADAVTTHAATCAVRTYTITLTRLPQARRASAVALTVQEGASSRTTDLTQTALGQLLTEPTGFGELHFACRPQRLFAFYRGATLASEASGLVTQSAVFTLSPEGEVAVPPPEGITVTPAR